VAKDAKTRARARALYEAGQSLNQIASELDLDRKSVMGWSKKGSWIKGKAGPKLDRKAEVALEAEAERHGITKAKVFAKIAELIDAKSVAVITTQGAVSLCPMLPNAKADKDGKAEFMDILYDVVPDRKTQGEMTKLAADVLGMKKQTESPDLANSILAWVRSQA
jgi:Putative ATPase subunit of terminase (gpP-like)